MNTHSVRKKSAHKKKDLYFLGLDDSKSDRVSKGYTNVKPFQSVIRNHIKLEHTVLTVRDNMIANRFFLFLVPPTIQLTISFR